MSNASLIYPMCALFALTVFVLVTMFRRRVGAVRAEQVPAKYLELNRRAFTRGRAEALAAS